MPTCSRCLTDKPEDQFGPSGIQNGKPRRRSHCRECCRKSGKKYREENPEARRLTHRRTHLKAKYDLTLEAYEAMLSRQNGACAICGDPSKGPLVVDHDHATGRVRGILCNGCNGQLGRWENPMTAWVRRHFEVIQNYLG